MNWVTSGHYIQALEHEAQRTSKLPSVSLPAQRQIASNDLIWQNLFKHFNISNVSALERKPVEQPDKVDKAQCK